MCPVMDAPHEPNHIKCPICGGSISVNKKLTHDVKMDKVEGCYNEWYYHAGDVLYKRTFHGHKFPN